MTTYRFSGHETFHCRHFWLKKGFDYASQSTVFKSPDSPAVLGVGKNMVKSIEHWLRAFGLIDPIAHELKPIAELLFSSDGFDPFLEDEGTLWLMHYQLQKMKYSSIYHMAFQDFRKSRVSFDFTHPGLYEYLIRQCMVNEIAFSEKTIANDVKVFLRSYLPPLKGSKSLEDDLSAMFIDLRLLYAVDGLKENGAQVYRFNYGFHSSLPPMIFMYVILDQFEGQRSITFEEIQRKVGDVFLCNQEQTLMLIDALVKKNLMVYNEDAGRKEIQIKTSKPKSEILKRYYA